MAKYHNGPKGPGVCRARVRPCPYGGAEAHFDSKEEALEAFNKKNEKEFGIFPKSEIPKPYRNVSLHDANGRVVDPSYYFNDFPGMSSTDKINRLMNFNSHDGLQFVKYANESKGSKGEWSVENAEGDEVLFKVNPYHPDDPIVYMTVRGEDLGTKTLEAINNEKLYPSTPVFEENNNNPWSNHGDYDFIEEKGSDTYVRKSNDGNENTYEFLTYQYDRDKRQYLMFRGKVEVTDELLQEVDDNIGLSDSESSKKSFGAKHDPEDVAYAIELSIIEKYDDKPGVIVDNGDYEENQKTFKESLRKHNFSQ